MTAALSTEDLVRMNQDDWNHYLERFQEKIDSCDNYRLETLMSTYSFDQHATVYLPDTKRWLATSASGDIKHFDRNNISF